MRQGLGLFQTPNWDKQAKQGYGAAANTVSSLIQSKNQEPREKEKSVGGGLMSAAGGAASGASVGAAIGSGFPGVGTAIGAGVGAAAYALG